MRIGGVGLAPRAVRRVSFWSASLLYELGPGLFASLTLVLGSEFLRAARQ